MADNASPTAPASPIAEPMQDMPVAVPVVGQVVLDCPDARGLAEFYRQLLAWPYREGDAPPPAGEPDPNGSDWLVLRNPRGGVGIAFQQVADLPAPTWPDGPRPQMLHLDLMTGSTTELAALRERVKDLGGAVLYDRFDDAQEPLYVFGDPAGHPFCIFVAPPESL